MQKWRVLAVDDDPDVCDVIHGALSDKYEVFTLTSGRMALEYLETIEPDFIILDVKMPDIDGYDLCHRIRQNNLFRKIPILFLSGLSGAEDQRKGYAEGADLFLTKPFDPIRLLKNIEVFAERNPPVYLRKRNAIEDLAALVVPAGLEPVLPGVTLPVAAEAPSKPAPSTASFAVPSGPKPAVAAAAGPEGGGAVWRLDIANKQAPTESAPSKIVRGSAAPSAVRAPQSAESGSPPAAGGAPRPRVLFVINDSNELSALATACEDEFEFIWSTDGLSALDKMKDFEPDAIVADTALPYMDGFELTRAIRGDEAFRSTPIIIYASKAGSNDRLTAQRAGANIFVRRPADPDRLVAALKEQISYQAVPIRPKRKNLQEVLDMIEFGVLHAPEDAI